MKLNAIPFEQLKVGDQVISARGTHGVIDELIEEGSRKEKELVIRWFNGNLSRVWHHWCGDVMMLEDEMCDEKSS